jgi:CRP/FNR family transcriptional regulator
MNINKEKLKKYFPYFDKELTEQIMEVGTYKFIKAGDILMKTGQYFRSTLLVLEGRVKVFREDDEGNEYFIYHIQNGQACALSMVCGNGRKTSAFMAVAETDLEVIAIPLDKMDIWMTENRSWYHFVLNTYRTRFEEVLDAFDQVVFKNLDERLVFYLHQHQKITKSNKINISITKIAQELNSSREVISRLLKKLVDKQMIILHHQQIEILNLEKLLS